MKRVTNKERVKHFFLEHEELTSHEASEVADTLNLKRNAASAILNELVRENFLIKEKTKPVLFRLKSREKEIESEYEEESVFAEIASSSYAMEQILNKCKISATYPGRGLPIILLGPSGVGKSMLAEKIYLYAKQKKKISEKAPFVVLNCADYANNKELLSSVLFGYKKGSFTGANKDSEGLFDKANNGYLFLDEVHRLPPEGQEKLFRYIDTGIITPLGGSANGKQLNVKLIFATTEDTDNVLLETFIRRIPITVMIPPYCERSSNERLQIVHSIFRQEAEILGCSFRISSNVLNHLLAYKGKGNIGSLKNIIKISCANAIQRQKYEEAEVEVSMQDLEVLYPTETAVPNQANGANQWICIDRDSEGIQHSAFDPAAEILQVDSMIEIIRKFLRGKCTYDEFFELNKSLMDKVMDRLVYHTEASPVEAVYKSYVETIFQFMQNNYGIEFNGTSINILTRVLALLGRNSIFIKDERRAELYEIETKLGKRLYRQAKLADVFYNMANQTIDYHSNEELLKLFLLLFFHSQMNEERPLYYGIIITHGYSTASSIASLVNQIYSRYIFDAFDMPYDTTIKEIVKRVRNHLKRINTSSGVIILADMGSVLEITDDISDLIEGNFGIINNVTTQMALEVGNEIIQRRDIEAILKTIVRYNSTTYHFIRQKEKETAILVCCMKGMEVAGKICELLSGCMEDDQIRVLEYDYEKLLRNGNEDKIFDLYNIPLIISTNEIHNIENVEILPLNELINSKGYDVLKNVLSKFYSEKEIEEIIEHIIKNFSLRNIMSELTILNPEIIINDVENVIHQMELEMKTIFTPDLKQLLYMHIGIMVERLMQERGQESKSTFAEFSEKQKAFCDMAKKCFVNLEKRYHVSVNIREIRLIYNIITSKVSVGR